MIGFILYILGFITIPNITVVLVNYTHNIQLYSDMFTKHIAHVSSKELITSTMINWREVFNIDALLKMASNLFSLRKRILP